MNWMLLVDTVLVVLGAALVFATLGSIIRTFVLPRAEYTWLTRIVQVAVWRVGFGWRVAKAKTYAQRDRVAAYFGPITLLVLPIVWLTVVLLAYSLIYYAIGEHTVSSAFVLSGSSLFTLGFATPDTLPEMALVFTEATLGLGLVALLIAYLPTIYSAFADREAVVAKLEVRAGAPPSAEEMLSRAWRIGQLGQLEQNWLDYEEWFTRIEESHTSLGILPFFRSSMPDRSWITAAGAVLDAAAIRASSLDLPRDPRADLMIRAGYLALNRIADFFSVERERDPRKVADISVTRAEFDAVLNRLAADGLPIKADREQAWRDFFGWRVNYDVALVVLANMILAPYAPWSSDRSFLRRRFYWRWDGSIGSRSS